MTSTTSRCCRMPAWGWRWATPRPRLARAQHPPAPRVEHAQLEVHEPHGEVPPAAGPFRVRVRRRARVPQSDRLALQRVAEEHVLARPAEPPVTVHVPPLPLVAVLDL